MEEREIQEIFMSQANKKGDYQDITLLDQHHYNERVAGFYDGIYELGTATVIGLGGGGEIALHLLRSGVYKMNLIDHDTLEIGNLVRHVCGNEYIGKNKAESVQKLLNGFVGHDYKNIIAHPWNIFERGEEFSHIVSNSDVVIVATDNDTSKFYANEICQEFGIPAVYVGMYENGCGGEIFSSTPDGGCYECATHFQGRKKFLVEYSSSVSKKDCSSARDTRAMSGLGIDQSFLSALASRKALDILLAKKGGKSLPPVGDNFIIWSLFGIPGITDEHITSIKMHIPKHENCSLCNN